MPDSNLSISSLLPTKQSFSSHSLFTSFQNQYTLGPEPPATSFTIQPHYRFRWHIGESYFTAVRRLQSEWQAAYHQANNDQLMRLYLNDINLINRYYGLPEVPNLRVPEWPNRQAAEPAKTWTLAEAYRNAIARAGEKSITSTVDTAGTKAKAPRPVFEPEPMSFQYTPPPADDREAKGVNTVFFVDGSRLILGGVSPRTTKLKVYTFFNSRSMAL